MKYAPCARGRAREGEGQRHRGFSLSFCPGVRMCGAAPEKAWAPAQDGKATPAYAARWPDACMTHGSESTDTSTRPYTVGNRTVFLSDEELEVFKMTMGKVSYPSPYTIHNTPHSLNPKLHTLHPIPYTLEPTPYTQHPSPYTPHPAPSTLQLTITENSQPSK